MIRFRNILVHAYAHVDVERVHENLQTGLDDFPRSPNMSWSSWPSSPGVED
jgi:uncharacterized protein YutE (UPF0331/DUF86 family)